MAPDKERVYKMKNFGNISVVAARVVFALIIYGNGVLFASPEAAAVPETGTLDISVTPQNASVSVDRKSYASTSLSLNLKPGIHYIEVKADGYKTERATVKVEAGELSSYGVDLKKETGIVLVTSKPEGAEVKIDGLVYGKTPLLLTDLNFGTYTADIFLGGYRGTTIQFDIVDRIPFEAPAELISDTATLRISSKIEGTEVSVNGIPRGKVPCVVEKVPAGDVIIEAVADGYKNFTQITKVSEAEVLNVEINMDIKKAALQIVSIPDKARVYFDNVFKGETPLLLEDVEPKEHRVRVEKDGYDIMARTIPLGRGEEITEEFRLKSNTGSLKITSKPEGVTVYIDGNSRGTTQISTIKGISQPLVIDGVASGKCRLRFSKPGYEEKNGEVEVVKGEIRELNVYLDRLFIPDYQITTVSGEIRKGVLISASVDGVRLELSPGVEKTFKKSEIISHGAIK